GTKPELNKDCFNAEHAPRTGKRRGQGEKKQKNLATDTPPDKQRRGRVKGTDYPRTGKRSPDWNAPRTSEDKTPMLSFLPTFLFFFCF
ncbi:MAG: hypothetical protein QGI15_05415, partial [Candidatus Scalindua sp.]|nr:hypothetical protein [Candidatus Scalindua sp.]